MTLADDGDKIFGADFVELFIGLSGNGNGKRIYVEAGFFSLVEVSAIMRTIGNDSSLSKNENHVDAWLSFIVREKLPKVNETGMK